MSSLHADLARASIAARHSEASDRRLATEVGASRRRDLWRPLRRRRDPVVIAARPIPLVRRTTPEPGAVLDDLLATVAQRIVEHGTASEARVLACLAAAVRGTNPGASAALVDRDGSEVARQRAFGVAQGVVVEHLDQRARAALMDEILGTGLPLAG
jgi:hypothetical protein